MKATDKAIAYYNKEGYGPAMMDHILSAYENGYTDCMEEYGCTPEQVKEMQKQLDELETDICQSCGREVIIQNP